MEVRNEVLPAVEFVLRSQGRIREAKIHRGGMRDVRPMQSYFSWAGAKARRKKMSIWRRLCLNKSESSAEDGVIR